MSVDVRVVDVYSPHEPSVEDQLSRHRLAMAEGVALHHRAIVKNQVSCLSLHAVKHMCKFNRILFSVREKKKKNKEL